jgi:2-methylcitrate dehydratase PrpD
MPYHADEGWHSTGTVGHLAAAAASAKLLNLSIPEIMHALGISATQAAGLKNVFGTMSKSLNSGKAAMNGLLASLLAERGFTGPKDAMGGKNGFLDVFSSRSNPETLDAALKGRYFLDDIRFKAYPSCFNTHAAIDCLLALRSQHRLTPEDVQEIECIVYPRCLEVSAIPRPENGLEAKFSIQYCLAAALHDGAIVLDSFDDSNVKRPSLKDTMNRITLRRESAYADTRTSEVVITTRDGRRFQEKVNLAEKFEDPKKEKSDVLQKFNTIAATMLPAETIPRIIELVDSLENVKHMSELISFF